MYKEEDNIRELEAQENNKEERDSGFPLCESLLGESLFFKF